MNADRRRLDLVAALVCLSLLAACMAPTGEDKLVYVFIDLTEIEENEGDYGYLGESIEPLMALVGQGTRGESRAGASVHIYPIYDFPLNKPAIAHLERGGRNQNALDRRDAVSRFEEELRAGIRGVVESNLKQRPPSETYGQSHIFGPLCEGLKSIQRQGSPENKRRVVVFSDMLENSPIGSFYQGQLNPTRLANALDSSCQLPDLSKTCVNIVFQPVKRKSELVLEAKSFWTRFFESKGLSTTDPSCFSYESYL
jgi:hypothetical protein